MVLANAPQLLLFAFVQLIYGALSLFDLFSTCTLLTGHDTCQPDEVLLLSLIGLSLTFVGLSVFVLTVIAFDDTAKKRRLAHVSLCCVSVQVAGAILAGSDVSGGIMPVSMHIAEVSVQLLLFIILGTAVWGDYPVLGHNHPIYEGLGINPRTFNGLYALMLLSFFVTSGINSYGDLLVNANDISDVAKFWWKAWFVYSFEAFLLYGYGFIFGNSEDNRVLAILTMIINVANTLQLLWFRDLVVPNVVRASAIQSVVIAVVVLLVILVHRRKRDRDYERIGGLVR